MTKRMALFLLGAFVVIGGGFTVYYLITPDETMAEADIQEMLEGRFSGSINSWTESSGEEGATYEAEFHSPQGTYLIEVAADDGRLLVFEQISEETDFQEQEERAELTDEEIQEIVRERLSAEAEILDIQLEEDEGGISYYSVAVNDSGNSGTLEIDANTRDILHYTQEDQIEPISEQEAVEIALNEHPGEVDDIDLEQKDGRLVFEIEIENDETGVDADIIIDAYSGEVLSVELD